MTSQPCKNQPHMFESSLGVSLSATRLPTAGLSARSLGPYVIVYGEGGWYPSILETRKGGGLFHRA